MKTWEDITLSDYYKLQDKIDGLTGADLDLSVVSFLNNIPEDTLRHMNHCDYQKLLRDSDLGEFTYNTDNCPKKVTIGNRKYRVDTHIAKWSTQQYMDFSILWTTQNFRQDYGHILACLLIPIKAKGYGVDYDVDAEAEFLYNNCNIVLANQLCFFFMIFLHNLQVILTHYSLRKARKMKAPADLMDKLQAQITRLGGLR